MRETACVYVAVMLPVMLDTKLLQLCLYVSNPVSETSHSVSQFPSLQPNLCCFGYLWGPLLALEGYKERLPVSTIQTSAWLWQLLKLSCCLSVFSLCPSFSPNLWSLLHRICCSLRQDYLGLQRVQTAIDFPSLPVSYRKLWTVSTALISSPPLPFPCLLDRPTFEYSDTWNSVFVC